MMGREEDIEMKKEIQNRGNVLANNSHGVWNCENTGMVILS